MADPMLCVETKVERLPDGMKITFVLADGRVAEKYMLFQEYYEWLDQMNAAAKRIGYIGGGVYD